MILDARSLPNDQVIESDLCLVGAGPAGITIARQFSAERVCLLESGGLELDESTQSLYEGENVGHGSLPLNAARLRYFGGTSNHWGGWCGMLSPIDFEERSWIPHSGWPFGLPELLPFYARAHPICDLGPPDYRPALWEDIAGAPRLPLDVGVLPTAIVQLSPPTRFGEKYRQELRNAQNVGVYLHANVLEIETSEQASHVTSIRVATLDGKRLQVRARAYVLATGGIENARLLLLSNAVEGAGLGNSHDLVGRFYVGHPTCRCVTLVPNDPYLNLRLYDPPSDVRALAILPLSEEVQRRESLPNAYCSLHPEYHVSEGVESLKALLGMSSANATSDDFADHIANIARDFGEVGSTVYRRVFGGTKRLQRVRVNICWEQAPSAASRVRLAARRDRFNQQQVELNWVVEPRDKEIVRRVAELLAREVGKAGIGRVQILLADEWSNEMSAAIHPMGATRMHADPNRGVVDADCRVHGIDNLYVAGSSVFPTSGYINPTLTIVALALRLADHLKGAMT